MLYFRFVAFVTLLYLILVAALVVGYFLPDFITTRGQDPELAMMILALVMYIVCWFAVIQWIFLQDRIVKADVEEDLHLRHYALVAEGFPKSARSPHEVKAFFESILGFEMEGVSIAYDFAEEIDFVDDRIARTIEKADTHLGVYPAELSGLESDIADKQDGYIIDCLMSSGYAFIVFSREEDREFCMRRFADIERQVKKGVHDIGEEEDSDDNEEALLLRTEPGRGRKARAVAGGGPSRAVLFRGKFPIRVGHAPEPCGIQWHNFSHRRSAKVVRVIVTLLVALLLVLVLSAVMFAPAVLYEMSYIDIRKPDSKQWGLAVLELGVVCASIAVGNRLLIAALKRSARHSGFLQKANEDSVFVVSAFTTILLNSVAPLIIAEIVAASESTTATRELATTWLFQTLWMCIVAAEMANILSPCWKYWTNYFWIRQNRYVSVREAEPAMTSGDFPFATRCADMMNFLSLLCVMIACDSSSLYTIGASCLMLLYGIYVYFVDKYMFLRLNRQTYYKSPKLDNTVHCLFVFPLTILFLFPLQEVYAYTQWEWWIIICILVGNQLIFLMIVPCCHKCNEPHRELSDIPYVEVASLLPYNYFNNNPVHVLRTLHFPSIVVPPLYPFLHGKEYLHGGQFADYDDSVRLLETLMLLAKSPLKGLDANPQDFG